MDDIQEAFTRRMVRRVSLRRERDRDGDLNTTGEDLQRRYNILKAIDEPSTRRESFTNKDDYQRLDGSHHDYSSKNLNFTRNSFVNNNEKSFNSSCNMYERSIEKLSISPNDRSADNVKSFELSNPNVWYKASNGFANKRSKNYRLVDDSTSDDLLSTDDTKVAEEPARLLKVRETNIDVPLKMIAQLKNIETTENRPNFVYHPHDLTQSSVTSLNAAIEDLDLQINNLEMRNPPNNTFVTRALVENSKRIYPVLEDIKFDSTGYTPGKKKLKNYVTHYETLIADNNCTQNINGIEENFTNNEISTVGKNGSVKKDTGNDENFVNREVDCWSENCLEVVKEAQEFDEKETFEDYEVFVEKKIDNDGLLYHETPKPSRKMPIMESTRKSLHSDSTKIKFPTPMRVDPNSISNITTTTNYKHDEILEGEFFNDTIPYEVERFLEDALGDELFNSTANMTFAASEPRDRTNSHFTASELISHDGTPLHKKIIQALKPPMTEPIRKNSSTLDRSMEMYRSFSQRIKKKFRSGIKTKENPPIVPILGSGIRETDKIRELLQELNAQQTLMSQATKALNHCNTMKEFIDSPERIESERLLLLANLRRKSTVEEIKRLASSSSDESKREERCNVQRGEITISDMSLNLRELIRDESEERESVEWFVLIVTQGLRVWATCPQSCEIEDSKISFPDVIVIPDLIPSFKVHVKVYTMKLRKSNYNHEEKYRIRNKHKRSTSCPPCPNLLVSPSKLLKKIDRPCLSPKIHYNHANRNKNTSFVLSGFVELFLHDLSLSSPWPLMLVPDESILQGTIDLSLACRLHLSVSHEGFVNHGDEVGGFAIWNRRWCVLKGHSLMFWNYPREQETNEPLKIVDLINCVSSRITTADRTICAKPRTLLFETARRKNPNDINSMIVECRTSYTIVRNLISLDSVHELMEWSTKLNNVIMALREWNVINVKTETQISDL